MQKITEIRKVKIDPSGETPSLPKEDNSISCFNLEEISQKDNYDR